MHSSNSVTSDIVPGFWLNTEPKLLDKGSVFGLFAGKSSFFKPKYCNDDRVADFGNRKFKITNPGYEDRESSISPSGIWTATIELPKGMRASSKVSATQLSKMSAEAAITKKMALDIYRFFGISTSASYLAITPWVSKTALIIRDKDVINDFMKLCVKLKVNKFLALIIQDSFQRFAVPAHLSKCKVPDGGGQTTVLDYMKAHKKFPETVLNPNGVEVPLCELAELCAGAKVLGDKIKMKQLKVVWHQNAIGEVVSARVLKDDQSIPFQFKTKGKGICSFGDKYKPVKDIVVKLPEKEEIIIKWDKGLREGERRKFLGVLATCSHLFETNAFFSHFFENEGSKDIEGYSMGDHYQRMIDHFGALRKVYGLNGRLDPRVQNFALAYSGWERSLLGEPVEGLESLKKAAQAFENLGDQEEKLHNSVWTKMLAGIILSRQGNFEEGKKLLNESIFRLTASDEVKERGHGQIILWKNYEEALQAFGTYFFEKTCLEAQDGLFELARCYLAIGDEEMTREEVEHLVFRLYYEYLSLHQRDDQDYMDANLVDAMHYVLNYCSKNEKLAGFATSLEMSLPRFDRLLDYPAIPIETKKKIVEMHFLVAEAYKELPAEVLPFKERLSRAFELYKECLRLHEMHLPVDELRAKTLFMMGKALDMNGKHKLSIEFFRDSVRLYRKLISLGYQKEQAEKAIRTAKATMSNAYEMFGDKLRIFDENEYNPYLYKKYNLIPC